MNTPSPSGLDARFLSRELNPAQLEAVNTTSGPVLILAGAGSGKTRVITFRIARLIDRGAAPGSIIALTFTNKAALEMKNRTLALLNMGRTGLWISTFHSACLRMLRQHCQLLDYPKDFAVYDAQDQVRLVKICLKELRIEEKTNPARQISSMISKFKNRMQGPEHAEQDYIMKMMKNAERGIIKLGGCIVEPNNPKWYCKRDKLEF